MSHGGSDKCEPNLVPLLDLVLQLVMFFMLCANFVLEQTSVAIVLPKAIAAKALTQAESYTIFLNVDEKGKVLLAPGDQIKDSEGRVIESLDNAAQVKTFLDRRAREDKAAMGAAATADTPLRSVIILRVHKLCPFEKVYPIMQACRSAGYLRVQLRALFDGSTD
jgi:biopolymer transport protein ExbD